MTEETFKYSEEIGLRWLANNFPSLVIDNKLYEMKALSKGVNLDIALALIRNNTIHFNREPYMSWVLSIAQPAVLYNILKSVYEAKITDNFNLQNLKSFLCVYMNGNIRIKKEKCYTELYNGFFKVCIRIDQFCKIHHVPCEMELKAVLFNSPGMTNVNSLPELCNFKPAISEMMSCLASKHRHDIATVDTNYIENCVMRHIFFKDNTNDLLNNEDLAFKILTSMKMEKFVNIVISDSELYPSSMRLIFRCSKNIARISKELVDDIMLYRTCNRTEKVKIFKKLSQFVTVVERDIKRFAKANMCYIVDNLDLDTDMSRKLYEIALGEYLSTSQTSDIEQLALDSSTINRWKLISHRNRRIMINSLSIKNLFLFNKRFKKFHGKYLLLFKQSGNYAFNIFPDMGYF